MTPTIMLFVVLLLLPRAEVVVVTTPQKLAQDVASRAASMARKTNMRLLGVIENMTGEIFGYGGGEARGDDAVEWGAGAAV